MRVLGSLPAAVLLAPSLAFAQAAAPGPASSPAIYVCTTAAQVVAITPSGSSYNFKVIAQGTGSFGGCVVGPDGWLYIANGQTIVRVDPEAAAAGATPSSALDTVATGFESATRGLAFNANTLYVTTASSGVSAVNFTSGDPLVFANKSDLFTAPGAGRGIAFDVDGDMIFASGTTIRRSGTPQYVANYSSSSQIGPAATASGVGINTCDNVLFTNPAGLSVNRLAGTSTTSIATFGRKERPNDLRIDPSNRLYVLTGEDDSGTNAKVFVLTPGTAGTDGGLTSCANYVKGSPLVELKSRLNGPTKIPFLTSANAVGIAIGPSAHRLTHTFAASLESCAHKFQFGYHSYRIEFAQCPDMKLEVTARQTEPFSVSFAGATTFPGTPRPVAYSPMGGFATEYQLKATPNPAENSGPDYVAALGFFTQQALTVPGVAKATDSEHPEYSENLGTEFWDLGPLDPSGGVRDRDFSWHVVFNAATPVARSCSLPEFLDSPLNGNPEDLSPLFNGPQNLPISFTATGTNCGGAVMRVSVARVIGTGPDQVWEPQTVRSDSQSSNVMKNVGNSYKYNLDASVLDTTGATAASPALFQITIWGELGTFRTYFFEVTKE